jgi:hypothetical protein
VNWRGLASAGVLLAARGAGGRAWTAADAIVIGKHHGSDFVEIGMRARDGRLQR